ncbi:MAG: outer membrane beta-barrel protein, partial [bacterium]
MERRPARLACLNITFALTTFISANAAAQAPTQAGVPVGTAAGMKADPAPKADSAATAPAAPIPTFFTEIQANAFSSFGYTYNLNSPASRLNGYRVFDSDANTFSVDVAELVLQRVIAKPGEAGFRIDLEVGGAIPQKTQALGLSIGQGADLQQAMVSYLAPVGEGLRLDFGKFVTPLGSEVIEGYDGYNDNYSRSFLFNYA